MKETINKLKWIFYQSKPGIIPLIISIIMGSILSVISVYNAVLSKSLIDAATNGQVSLVIKWLTVMAGIILFNILFGSIRSLISTYCSTTICNELQRKFFTHVTYSDWLENSKHHSTGMLTRITSDVYTINGFICGTFPSMITASVMIIISFFTLLKIQPILATFIVLVFPLLFIMNKLLGKRIKKFYNQLQEKNIEYSSFIQESIQNIMIVKTFCKEQDTISKLHKLQKDIFQIVIKENLFRSFTGICFSIGSSGAYFIVFAWGAISLVSGTITFGTMTALLQLFNKIKGPLSSLMGCYTPIITAIAAAERLMKLENIELEQEYLDSKLTVSDSPYIAFNNISFGYNNNNILKDISFDINPGEIIALVGPSGQGKTTILRLLLSLIKPNQGNLYIGNSEIKEQIYKNHRELISYIPQGNTLFSGTVRENITYGNATASEDEIYEACNKSCSLEFINKLENKLDTKLGEKGMGISEGQAQRIAIARALLRKKPILILDEATSSLDPKTEINVLKAIKELDNKPTCIIITHRPSALEICDRVLRLENGTLVEESKDTYQLEAAISLN